MTVFPAFNSIKKKIFKKTVHGFIPNILTVPLLQEENNECTPLVKIGDNLKEGQLIASLEDRHGIDSNIYSPVPGIVLDFVDCNTPDGKICRGIKIKVGGAFSFLGKKLKKRDLAFFSPRQLISEIAEKGVVNTFITDKPYLLARQIKSSAEKKQGLVIVRLYDEDPSRIIDSIITKLHTSQVFKGANITARAMNAKAIVFIAENDFQGFDKNLTNQYKIPFEVVRTDEKMFPSGFKMEICKAVKKECKESPYSDISEDDLYTDAVTVYDVYRSVIYDMPVIDRYVHITGDCLNASGIIKTPIGTPISSLIEQVGGLSKKPYSIIINGMVSGISAGTVSANITKYVKSVSVLPYSMTPDQSSAICIRCGNCRRCCPRKLSPDVLYAHISGTFAAASIYIESAVLCLNCGICNSVCPSRLPIWQNIEKFNNREKTQTKEILENANA